MTPAPTYTDVRSDVAELDVAPIGGVDLKGRPRNTNQFARITSSATRREQEP